MTETRRDAVRALLDVVLECNDLKSIPRMGWAVRGIRNGESVAEHSYAVALLAMFLADRMDEAIDGEKLLKIALLHDLPEYMLGDIHAPATRMLGEEAKEAAEERILEELFSKIEGGETYVRLWKEFADRSSIEGRLVRAADKLEMFTQAFRYEREGTRTLEKFWGYDDNTRDFEFEEVRELYDELVRMRTED
jgi:putative hydrolase of HD superfamily